MNVAYALVDTSGTQMDLWRLQRGYVCVQSASLTARINSGQDSRRCKGVPFSLATLNKKTS